MDSTVVEWEAIYNKVESMNVHTFTSVTSFWKCYGSYTFLGVG